MHPAHPKTVALIRASMRARAERARQRPLELVGHFEARSAYSDAALWHILMSRERPDRPERAADFNARRHQAVVDFVASLTLLFGISRRAAVKRCAAVSGLSTRTIWRVLPKACDLSVSR